jgi:hypothetical protein
MVCDCGVAALPHRSEALQVRTMLLAREHVLMSQLPEPEPESEKLTLTRVQPFWVAVAWPVLDGSVLPPQATIVEDKMLKIKT